MTEQGEQQTSDDGDDWWSQLYDPGASDTGRSWARDTLDDRFASVTWTMGEDAPTQVPPPRAPLAKEPVPEPDAGPELEPDAGPEPGPEGVAEPDPEPEPDPVSGPEPTTQLRTLPAAEPEPTTQLRPVTEPEPEPESEAQSEAKAEAEPAGAAEGAVLPLADPRELKDVVPDTELEGASFGPLTLRAVSLRGAATRRAGAPRGDALLVARFGSGGSGLLLIAVAHGHRAAREICHSIGVSVGRSHARLAEDISAGRRGALKSGLNRLTDRAYGKLRAQAAVLGLEPAEHTAELRCLLLPADPRCRMRVFFGVGDGGLFRLRDDEWQDIEPRATDPEPGEEEPDAEPFRFRASEAQPGDVLLLCGRGFAEPMRGEPVLADRLAVRWAGQPVTPEGFLTDVRARYWARAYEADRTVAAVWEP
ncbi:protein phosphatase 2C domain-containing protein [Streptomyces boncukensis]|uniref:PPM-type phosphatase domain-containing protein n=1 Tax=Streptomyces boncukensis TaxID=2711219 RepID=A0A6G4WZ77_9ACTN|nr:protein phosphatase 2C domain-containing protein [Streptomyces boncukensis]NGO69824.1 hypothetical protein [Streptomyces boncukensis]